MGEFQGSLKVVGDAASVPADLAVVGGRLVIKSGDHPIGDWALADMDLVQEPDGIHLKVEGEHLLLEVPDPTAFAVAAGLHKTTAPTKSKLLKTGRRSKMTAGADSDATTPKSVDTVTIDKKPKRTRAPRSLPQPVAKGKAWLDENLPAWATGKAAAVIGLVFLVLAIVFTTVVSTVLIIAGIVTLIAGAFGMTDQMVAARFPAHITPMGCILGGGGLIVFGILVGILL